MPSPRVLQAQLQDLLDSVQGDARLRGVAEALEGALGGLRTDGEQQAGPSPGQRAAKGEHADPESYWRPQPGDGGQGPKSFHEARDAAVTAMGEANRS